MSWPWDSAPLRLFSTDMGLCGRYWMILGPFALTPGLITVPTFLYFRALP